LGGWLQAGGIYIGQFVDTEHIENALLLSLQTVYNRRMDIIYQLQGVEFEWCVELSFRYSTAGANGV
jgi:hypothetical protein